MAAHRVDRLGSLADPRSANRRRAMILLIDSEDWRGNVQAAGRGGIRYDGVAGRPSSISRHLTQARHTTLSSSSMRERFAVMVPDVGETIETMLAAAKRS